MQEKNFTPQCSSNVSKILITRQVLGNIEIRNASNNLFDRKHTFIKESLEKITLDSSLDTSVPKDDHFPNIIAQFQSNASTVIDECSIQPRLESKVCIEKKGSVFLQNSELKDEVLNLTIESTDIPKTDSLKDKVIGEHEIDNNPDPYISKRSVQEHSSQTLKRKSSTLERDIPNKKVRFKYGFQMRCISREDFVSHEAWQNFLIYNMVKNRQAEKYRKQKSRIFQKISNVKQLVAALKEKQDHAAAEYLEVDT